MVIKFNPASILDTSIDVKPELTIKDDGVVSAMEESVARVAIKPNMDEVKEEVSVHKGITKDENQQVSVIKEERRPISVSRNPLISMEIKKEENKEMAEVDTIQLSAEHSDLRREATEHTNEIVKEGLKGNYSTLDAIKDSRFETVSRVESAADRIERDVFTTGTDISGRVESNADRLTNDIAGFRAQTADRFFQVARDTSDLRAQVAQVLSDTRLVGANISKDNEISVLKNTIENQKNTQYLADKISSDGDKTRELVNELKYGDLNRELIERSARLAHGDYWHWGRFHHFLDGNWQNQAQSAAQMAALQSQMQNFNSQLNETRQGIVNFGTQSGLTQASSNNNVR